MVAHKLLVVALVVQLSRGLQESNMREVMQAMRQVASSDPKVVVAVVGISVVVVVATMTVAAVAQVTLRYLRMVQQPLEVEGIPVS